MLFSLKSIKELNEKHKIEYENVKQAYEISEISLQQNTINYPQIEKSYRFYQQCRAYLHSYLECYNEKVTNLDMYYSIYLIFHFIKDDNHQ